MVENTKEVKKNERGAKGLNTVGKIVRNTKLLLEYVSKANKYDCLRQKTHVNFSSWEMFQFAIPPNIALQKTIKCEKKRYLIIQK